VNSVAIERKAIVEIERSCLKALRDALYDDDD
jgi:hypothetical protein